MVKQKIFDTRPGVQSPEEQGSQAVWEGAGTGTCLYFLPPPTPLASSLLAMGISDALCRITYRALSVPELEGTATIARLSSFSQ